MKITKLKTLIYREGNRAVITILTLSFKRKKELLTCRVVYYFSNTTRNRRVAKYLRVLGQVRFVLEKSLHKEFNSYYLQMAYSNSVNLR